MNKRVAIYTRLSPNPDKDDTVNQYNDLVEFAKRSNWDVIAVYSDVNTSGSKKGIDRQGFTKLMTDVSKKKFDIVLFWSLDRLSREGASETLGYFQTFNNYGVDYRSYTEPFFDSCGVFKEAVIAIMATIAKQERIRLIERTKAGLRTAVAKGVRLGRRKVTEKTKSNPNPITLERVKELSKEGMSGRGIAKYLKVSNATISRMLIAGKGE